MTHLPLCFGAAFLFRIDLQSWKLKPMARACSRSWQLCILQISTPYFFDWPLSRQKIIMQNKTHDMMNRTHMAWWRKRTWHDEQNFSLHDNTKSKKFLHPFTYFSRSIRNFRKIVEIFLHPHIHRLRPIPNSQNTLKTNPKAEHRIVKLALKTHQNPHSDAFKKGFVLIFFWKKFRKNLVDSEFTPTFALSKGNNTTPNDKTK